MAASSEAPSSSVVPSARTGIQVRQSRRLRRRHPPTTGDEDDEDEDEEEELLLLSRSGKLPPSAEELLNPIAARLRFVGHDSGRVVVGGDRTTA